MAAGVFSCLGSFFCIVGNYRGGIRLRALV
jgi:hypothetical protein